VPSSRITDILNGRRSITAHAAVRLGQYFESRAQFGLNLQSQRDIAVIEREHGAEIARCDLSAPWKSMPYRRKWRTRRAPAVRCSFMIF
jgi:plasmid maintenance system antidote protein VapI